MNYPTVRIRHLEGLLGFHRQSYYQYWKRQAHQHSHEVAIIRFVKTVRQDHPRIGGRKLYLMLKADPVLSAIPIGRDNFFELLGANKLLIRRRRRRVITTFSRHRFRKYPNLIKDMAVERPNKLWVADITYWFTRYGCLYISLVTDAYSKRIMGYEVAPTLEAVNCKVALQMALDQLEESAGKYLIHHSDRGIQYCSNEYIGLLDSYQVSISMTQNGDPLENPVAERVNGILKNEYLAHQPVYTLAQAKAVLGEAVNLYNYKRPHFSCDFLVPDEAHQQEGKLRRRWKNAYVKKQVEKWVVNVQPD